MPENGLNDGAAEAPGSTRAGCRLPLITARSRPHRPAWWTPWLIAGFVFAVYLVLSLFRYLQFNPASWDLGIFTEQVKQYAHLHAPVADIRGAGFNLLGDHFSPIVALVAPFFLLCAVAGHLAGGPGRADRGIRAPGDLGRGREAGAQGGCGHRGRVRALLGPAADDRLRLPRDRLRPAAAGLLAGRADPRPLPQRGAVGAAAGVRQGRPGVHRRGPGRGDDRDQPVARTIPGRRSGPP